MKFSLARNYRGTAAPAAPLPGTAAAVGELSHLGLGELEALKPGAAVRVRRFGCLVVAEVVSLGAVPPLRQGRRVLRDVHNRTTPDVGARRVRVRLSLAGGRRARVIEVKARDLLSAAPLEHAGGQR